MNKDISSYAKVYKNFLDRETCLQTIEQTKSVNFEQHKFYNHGTGWSGERSGNQELESFTDVNFDVSNSKLIIDKLWHAIKKYTLDEARKAHEDLESRILTGPAVILP